MRRLIVAWAAAVAMATPAGACPMRAPLHLEDVKFADLVVVGSITDYRLVRDPVARANYERLMARYPADSPLRSRSPKGFLTDYARFTVTVEEVLQGVAPRTFEVTWDASTFAEPERMDAGPFLIALRRPGSPRPPLRAGSATVVPNRAPNVLTVLQAPCSSAFIFQKDSAEAEGLRKILGQERPS